MLKRIQARIQKMIAGKTFADDDELYLYLALAFYSIIAGFTHALLFTVMLVLDVKVMAIVNVVSVCIYMFSVMLVLKRRAYRTVGMIISGETIIYTFLSCILFGANTHSFMYYFLVLVLQLSIPYAHVKVRMGVSALLAVAVLVSTLMNIYVAPVYSLWQQDSILLLSLVNVNMVFLGIVLELSLGNVIRSIISKSNAERMDEYRNQANTDLLTGLYNRRHAEAFIAELMTERRDNLWCVAMLDVDDFKRVNDSRGHSVGDRVLCSLADTLTKSLRKTDVLFRWGGEEFLIFLSGVELETAKEILEKICKKIAKTALVVENTEVHFTVTIGVAKLNMMDIEAAIALCDKRLYHGKQNGKNQVVAEGEGI